MKTILTVLVSFIAVSVIFVTQYFESNQSNFTLVFCDVGQGDAIYMRVEGKDILIDGGPDKSVIDCLSRHMPLFDRKIELAVVTHADSDHYKGMLDVLSLYNVENFATSRGGSELKDYQNMMRDLNQKNIFVRRHDQGDKIKIGEDVVIDVLWPPEEFSKIDDDRNNSSLVFLVDYNDFETILTGDLDREYLNLLLDDLNQIEVFKLAHHGSRTGTDEDTFKDFKPELSIISAGKNNRFGHPHKEVLEVLKRFHLNYKTTFEGDVVIKSNGNDWRVNGSGN